MSNLLFAAQDPGAIQAISPVIGAIRLLPKAPKCHLAISRHTNVKAFQAVEGSDCSVLQADDDESFRRILREIRPAALITGSSAPYREIPVTPEQRLHALCKEYGIPSILILDFWGNYAERFSDFGSALNPKYVPTWICALDEKCKKMLISAGIDAAHISITHSPYYDSIVAESQGPCRAAEKRGQLKIVFISQPHADRGRAQCLGYDQFTNFAALMKGLSYWNSGERKDVFVWIHPTEDENAWARTVEKGKFPCSVRISNDRDRAFVEDTDLVCSAFSTSLYRFLYHGVPGISLQIGRRQPDQLITNELGLTVPIYDCQALRAVFSGLDLSALRQRVAARKEELSEQGIFFSRGNATQKVMALLQDVLAGEQRFH